MRRLDLHTVCEEAACPNLGECWANKHATVMILGSVCTRACAFCNVETGTPDAVDESEPEHLAEAIRELGLEHVVITSVDRDDLPDGGARHFARCIAALREHAPDTTIEVLTPDFRRKDGALETVVEAHPDVFNHNCETVPRLYRRVRGPRSDYRWTLQLLEYVKQQDPSIKTKSGLMLGLGETWQELLDVLVDLREHRCDFLTLGQYLQPDVQRYLPVARYLPPEEFSFLGQAAKEMGFRQVASGPFVRSSYHAREMAEWF